MFHPGDVPVEFGRSSLQIATNVPPHLPVTLHPLRPHRLLDDRQAIRVLRRDRPIVVAEAKIRSSGQSKKLMTHRLADWSGRSVTSSQFRYGNKISLFPGSLSINTWRFLRGQHESQAENDRTLKGLAGVRGEAVRRSSDRARFGEERRDTGDLLLIKYERPGPLSLS